MAPPPSRSSTFLPLRANSTASVMPAAPAPAMQISATKPCGGVSLRRSWITGFASTAGPQKGDDLLGVDDSDELSVMVDYWQGAEIVFVEELGNFAAVGV